MSYVAIDTQGARALGQVLQETAGRVDDVRRRVSAALDLADLGSQVPAQLAQVQDGFTTLSAGVTDKAALAEQFVLDPQAAAASLGAPVDQLGAAISGLLGFAGPADLRAVLVGLPTPGANPALDAALARLNPVLLPTFLAGQRPELTEAQVADLRILALALGIEHAGPPVARVAPDTGEGIEVGGFLGRLLAAALDNRAPLAAHGFLAGAPERTGTEVFWNDFWTGGRTVDGVLADPDLLMQWVAGTFELDRRLALATGLPTLADVLTSVDFATTGSDPGQLATLLATAENEFAAIADWLPAFLVGQDRTGPNPTRLAQTLAFASRVGWPDPGPEVASEQARFADAIAFLRANRALQSALLPTGFEGDGDPLAFMNGPGIGFVLDLGRRTGVLDDSVLGNIAGTIDLALAAFGIDVSGPAPVELTEQLQQQLFALLSTQIPRSALERPAIQAQFVAALGYLRAAASGPEQRQRLIEILAAFRTLAVTGAPALTEAQLVAAVGTQILGVLGRGRLRARSQAAVQKNPEFLLVARQWGLPGSKKQDLGKYKFSWSFDGLGVLTSIRRKKKSWLTRTWETIKGIGEAIWKAWEDNPLKAIFQIGKIALGAAAFFVPGLQALGAASLALSAGEAVFKAAEGDWLGAIGAGLSAFTAGASDVFSPVAATGLDALQHDFVKILFNATTPVSPTLELLKNLKRVFDIGTTIFNFTQANTLVAQIATGLGAGVTALGSGSQLLDKLDVISPQFAQDLARIGVSVADVVRFVTPAAGLIDALDKNNVLAAFGNGLSILSAGARVVSNPTGAFADPLSPSAVPQGLPAARPAPFAGVLSFDGPTLQHIFELSQGLGAVAGVAKAIDAANRGDTFAAGTFLAQAVQALNDPVLKKKDEIAVFNQARVAERIAELGVLFQAVFDRKAPAAVVAPLVLARLQAVLDAANPAVPKEQAAGTSRPATMTQESRPGQRTGVTRLPNTTAFVDTFTVAASPFLGAEVGRQPDEPMSLGVGVPVDRSDIVAVSETTAQFSPAAESTSVVQDASDFATAAVFAAEDAQPPPDALPGVTGALLAGQGPVVITADPATNLGNAESSGPISRAIQFLASFVVSPAAADDGVPRLVPRDEPLQPRGVPIPLTGPSNVPDEPIVRPPFPIVEPPRPGRILWPPNFVELPAEQPILEYTGPFTISNPELLDLGPIDYGANGIDLSRIDTSGIVLRPPPGVTLNIGGRWYGNGVLSPIPVPGWGGGANIIYDPQTGNGSIFLEVGWGHAAGIWSQLGLQPADHASFGIDARWTNPVRIGSPIFGQQLAVGPHGQLSITTDGARLITSPWGGLGAHTLGVDQEIFNYSWANGFIDPGPPAGPFYGYIPPPTNRVALTLTLPFSLGGWVEYTPPGPPTLMEDYPGQWLERRVRNLNLQPDVFPNELDGQRIDWGPPPPELGRRSDVVPEEQPVQLASSPDVSVTGGTDSLFAGAVAGLTPEFLAGFEGVDPAFLSGSYGNTDIVTTNLYGGPGFNLTGLAETDPFPTTALFEGFDPSMDLSSMYA